MKNKIEKFDFLFLNYRENDVFSMVTVYVDFWYNLGIWNYK